MPLAQGEYLLVLLFIMAVPLLRSGDPRLGLRTRKVALAVAVLIPSVIYWTWDVWATARGHWSFNPAHILGVTLLGLPIEEWAFFPVIGFVSVFTWEAVRHLMGKHR